MPAFRIVFHFVSPVANHSQRTQPLDIGEIPTHVILHEYHLLLTDGVSQVLLNAKIRGQVLTLFGPICPVETVLISVINVTSSKANTFLPLLCM